ncbi:SRPBCC family protein [Occultella gossypii]|uniref:SRPBCC family protein n=1 Tax=Occultella gossypii TaxID=2800820 RepID=A0ABS7SG62_9MICO|nr:SRPBCC family protein [Occultella gossypii]MBZ2199047.1 SRPBCC family protein [Occultella gossypii]
MSTAPQERTNLHVDITVEVPVDHAFRVFTGHFDEIKPRAHNLLPVPIERTVLEPRVGGTIYDIGTDGSICTWARVLAYEPPHRLAFSWDISPQWRIEPDPARTSEVEIRFTSEAPDRTRVVLEHRNLDRHGQGWEGFTSLDTGDGWPLYLARYRDVAERVARDGSTSALA